MRALLTRIYARSCDRWLTTDPRPPKPLAMHASSCALDVLDMPWVWRMERAHRARMKAGW